MPWQNWAITPLIVWKLPRCWVINLFITDAVCFLLILLSSKINSPHTSLNFFYYSQVANMIRFLVDSYNKPIPAILEIPSKDHPYDPAHDSVLSRVKNLFSAESVASGRRWWFPQCSIYQIVSMILIKDC